VLIVAGLHVPAMPLVEVAGREGADVLRQSGPIWLKVGVIPGLTVIVRVAVVAHWPAAGVNVYVVVAVLFSAGAHVPVMPLFDVVGKGERAAPEHIGATAVNVGVIELVTTISIVVETAH
jgi:hypothetical protein